MSDHDPYSDHQQAEAEVQSRYQNVEKTKETPDEPDSVACFSSCTAGGTKLGPWNNKAALGVGPFLEWDNRQVQGCVVRPGSYMLSADC